MDANFLLAVIVEQMKTSKKEFTNGYRMLVHFLMNVEVVVSFCLLSRYISSDIISVDYSSKSIEMVCNSDTIYSIED